MPALGFMAAGMEPTPPGKAIFLKLITTAAQSKREVQVILLQRRCDAPPPGTFAEFRAEDGRCRAGGSWHRHSSVTDVFTHVASKRFGRVDLRYSDSHYASTTVHVYPKLGSNMYNYANAMLYLELFHTANHLFNKFFNTELDIAVNGVAS